MGLLNEFKTISLHLNKIGIIPTLMGSLGLEFVSKENGIHLILIFMFQEIQEGGKHLMSLEFMIGIK